MGADLDDELVVKAGRGDPAAIRALVTRKLPRVLILAFRMLGDPGEAEDVAQETFLRAWKFAPRWRPGQARFDTWLHRVALNLCYDRLRRSRPIPVLARIGISWRGTWAAGRCLTARASAEATGGHRVVSLSGADQHRGGLDHGGERRGAGESAVARPPRTQV